MDPIFLIEPDGTTSAHEESDILRGLQDGSLNQNWFFWKEGMPAWQRLSEFKVEPGPALVPPRRPSTTSLPSILNREAPTPSVLEPAKAGGSAPPARKPGDTQNEPTLGQFRLRRLGAIVFDTAFLFIAPVAIVELFPRDRVVPGKIEDNVLLAAAGYCLLIFTIQVVLGFRGQTIGKRVFRLRAIDRRKWQISGVARTMGRLFTHGALILVPFAVFTLLPFFPPLFFVVCAYAVLDGFFIFFGDRCIHDYCGGTVVVSDHHL